MKKLCAFFLSLALLTGLAACGPVPPPDTQTPEEVSETFPGFPTAPEAFHAMSEAELRPYLDLAEEAFRRYVMAVQFPDGAPRLPQFPLQMTPPLQKLMLLRFENDTQYDDSKAFAGFTISKSDWAVFDGRLLCDLGAHLEFRYADASANAAMGVRAQLLIENPRAPTLADWYDFGDGEYSWDCLVRGLENTHQNLSNPANWLGNCRLLAPADKIYD